MVQNLKVFFNRGFSALERYGFSALLCMCLYRLKRTMFESSYNSFALKRDKFALKTTELKYKPLISFVVPVYNVEEYQLRECIQSVLNQTYDNFELILADDASTWKSVPKVLKEYEGKDKIKVIYRSENGNIFLCTNTGIEAAEGEFIALLDCDDILAPNALYEITKLLNENPSLDFIYSDEDKIDNKGKKRSFPNFKPDYSPDTLLSLMYTCHLGVYRRSIIKEIGGLRAGFEGAQDYDLVLRFCEKTDKIGHIQKLLYHWRKRPESTAAKSYSKDYTSSAAFKLKEEALKRRGVKGKLEEVQGTGQYRVVYDVPENALVSIIIPSKDNFDVLKRCILSIIQKTEYKNYDIIVVDNGSSDENKEAISKLCTENNIFYHYEKEDFNFSKMCNKGAELSKGDFLIFLNDDTEIIDGKWLERMTGQAAQPLTGAVGAKLLYPNSTTIQHDGIINLPVGPSHALLQMNDKAILDFGRNRLDFNYIAVTAACLCIDKKKFFEIGGFFEGLKIAYNDVDLCFKLYEKGYYNVVRNDAVLYHYESLSRGNDEKNLKKLKRFEEERELLYSRHPNLRGKDPFHNNNLAKNRLDFDADYNRPLTYSFVSEKNKLLKSSNIKGRLYNVFDGDVLDIRGQAYFEKGFLNGFNKTYLVLISQEDKAYAFETQSYIDPESCLKGEKDRGGFCCYIEKDCLDKGTYNLGSVIKTPILKKQYVIYFGKTITL
ncbi:MAG: glycosyltransferase [Clostridiales bacterium]|nr:glycosyltransferase [Clostridiales bacterium]